MLACLLNLQIDIVHTSVYNKAIETKTKEIDKMKIFKPMPIEQAKELYQKLCGEFKKTNSSIIKMAADDIFFFTNGLTKDY